MLPVKHYQVKRPAWYFDGPACAVADLSLLGIFKSSKILFRCIISCENEKNNDFLRHLSSSPVVLYFLFFGFVYILFRPLLSTLM